MQYDQAIGDPFLGLTDSECIVAAKNATLQANQNNTAPANVWNYCSTGACNFTMPNGTDFAFISPYAESHDTSICQLGYSSTVDNNEYVEPLRQFGQTDHGQGVAGGFRFHLTSSADA